MALITSWKSIPYKKFTVLESSSVWTMVSHLGKMRLDGKMILATSKFGWS